ncbi:MAG TPA: hypothetical protein VLR69_21660 [Thermoanaerobaculia bacterium]|nr:hypothetical protein [Thermoanaerobaculia bacterium]
MSNSSNRGTLRDYAGVGATFVLFLALLAIFPDHLHLILWLFWLLASLLGIAATLTRRDADEIPPASAEFLAAADPTRPLDELAASPDPAFAPAAADAAREPLLAAALKPEDSVPAGESIGRPLFRRLRRDIRD